MGDRPAERTVSAEELPYSAKTETVGRATTRPPTGR